MVLSSIKSFSLRAYHIIISLVILGVFLTLPTEAQALKVGDLPVGSAINLSETKFVKINNQGLFMAVDPYDYYLGTPTTMQEMSKAYCQFMTVCNIGDDCGSNGSTITLTDSRDGKSYRVRKFADGHCWMIDNLAYGGTTDACASKTSFSGNGSATATNTFGTGTYGDCRNNPSSATYGYLYNWQAAMQQSLAYYGSDYAGPVGNNGSGVCPSPWRLPPDSGTASFYTLHTTYGSPTSPNFWANASYWNGIYAGLCSSSSSLSNQGNNAYYWSSSQINTSNVYLLYLDTNGYAIPNGGDSKNFGYSVRCVL